MTYNQAIKIAIEDMMKRMQTWAPEANIAARMGDNASPLAKKSAEKYALRAEAIRVLEKSVYLKQVPLFPEDT